MRMARLRVKRWAGTKQETELDIYIPPNDVNIHIQPDTESAGSVYTRHYSTGELDLAMSLSEALEELNAAMNEPVSGILNMPVFGPDKPPGREEGKK